jgi:anti-sigma factor RsiW
MAESGSPAEVRGTAAANGRVQRRDADAIVAEIEQTRDSLARTIDTLAGRVSPANAARRLREQAAGQLAKPRVQLGVAAAGVAVAGLLALRIFGRRKS